MTHKTHLSKNVYQFNVTNIFIILLQILFKMRLHSVGFYIFAGCILAIFVAEVYWIEYATLNEIKQNGLRKVKFANNFIIGCYETSHIWQPIW